MAHEGPGHRRIDRVLADDFLAGITTLEMAELRTRRDDAEQEAVDASYLRRLVQGRIDILTAELARRSGGPDSGSLIDDLPQILAESGERAAPHGMGRHDVTEPSRADEHRRYVEGLVADVDLSDVSARTDDELRAALEVFQREEAELSAKRNQVHAVLDRFRKEVTRRYRDGEADVAELLAGNTPPS